MTVNRPRKPPHTEAERAELAARLQAMYPVGMPVTTWVKSRHADLTKLTKGVGSWSWGEIATVLNHTTIRYEAGVQRPDGTVSTGRWSGPSLKAVVQKGRAAEQLRASKQSPLTIGEAARAAAEATVAALLARGLVVMPGQPTTSSREAIQHLAASVPASAPAPSTAPESPSLPKVQVFGAISAEPAQPEAEPGSIQRMVDEKNARTQSIISRFLNREKDNGSQG